MELVEMQGGEVAQARPGAETAGLVWVVEVVGVEAETVPVVVVPAAAEAAALATVVEMSEV